jgi:hypothetical protein
MKFLDPDHPMFARPVVRWLTVLVPLAWSVVEFRYMASPVWGVIFLAMAAFAAYTFFLRRKS